MYLNKESSAAVLPTDRPVQTRAARYLAGVRGFFAAGLDGPLAAGLCSTGAVFRNRRAMSSIVKGDGSSCLAGLG